ncbi:hypothetical protein [Peribacillus muralis]
MYKTIGTHGLNGIEFIWNRLNVSYRWGTKHTAKLNGSEHVIE